MFFDKMTQAQYTCDEAKKQLCNTLGKQYYTKKEEFNKNRNLEVSYAAGMKDEASKMAGYGCPGNFTYPVKF